MTKGRIYSVLVDTPVDEGVCPLCWWPQSSPASLRTWSHAAHVISYLFYKNITSQKLCEI